MKENFLIGEMVYLTHGIGELRIEAVKILKISRKIATLQKDCGGEEIKVSVASLVSSSELMKEVYNYMQWHTYHNIKNRETVFKKNKKR